MVLIITLHLGKVGARLMTIKANTNDSMREADNT
jgi:hypothetical protein